tara:strand:+ start:6650 stop:9127 length:2478 start_codon:yes stop_codon:yes gene_type:complete
MKLNIKGDLDPCIKNFFNKNGWDPLTFQVESWQSYLRGENGIIQVPTGCGKTYAAIIGPLLRLKNKKDRKGLNILLISPLKALSRDLKLSIGKAASYFDKDISIGIRNGDTSTYEKKKQLLNPPNILITTPESLSLLIANTNSKVFFSNLISIIVDEWHELMGSKRGNQCELNLSWLRNNKKNIQLWALSATLGNIEEAGRAIVGIDAKKPTIIKSELIKEIEIKSIIPENIGTFPWSGHLGLKSHKSLFKVIDKNKSTLLFTNTRNQSERWFQCLRYYYPEMENKIALHHGSLDKEERKVVEDGVKNESIKWVVCTSSLDLGVDFQPVDQIVQIGSAKNLARLIQRAGRSAHKPGGKSIIIFMPTNALELLEVSAIRRVINSGLTEKIHLPELSFDVLLQHLVSLACGPGFEPDIEIKKIKDCWSFRNIREDQWFWCLNFLENGGKCLKAYPRYKKLIREYINEDKRDFKFLVKDEFIKRIHKFNIGTITSDNFVTVKYLKGRKLGNLEENFASKLKKGDIFFFAGKMLEFVKMKDMILHTKKSNKKSSIIPAWIGGQMAISDLLSECLRKELSIYNEMTSSEISINVELQSLLPIFNRQKFLSSIPKDNELLLEIYKTKEFKTLFVFPLEGKFVNEGLAFLWALRLAKINQGTFSIAANDFGFSLTANNDYDFSIIKSRLSYFLSTKDLSDDLENAINHSELTKKKFKNIAQISGLVNNHNPSKLKNANQLQISSNLLFDVFERFENDHLLISQAYKEVNREQLESGRIIKCLKRLSSLKIIINKTSNPSPLAFPLLVERLKNTLSNESIEKRVERLIKSYEL